MPKQMDVLSYGTIGMDYIIRVKYWPTPALGVHAPGEEAHLGGKALNTAVFLAAWGTDVALCGNVIGGDAVGVEILERISHLPRLHTDFLMVSQTESSMYCRILVNPAGERMIIGINVDEVTQTPPTESMIGSVKLVTMDLYGGSERVDMARLAHKAGKQVVVGDLRDIEHQVLPFTTTAIASLAELKQSYPDVSIYDISRRILEAGPTHLLVTSGSEPVSVFSRDGSLLIIEPPVVDVADTTGAGDAFRAGVVYGLYHGLSIVQAAALGTAVGSLNVMTVGAANNPPALKQVKDLAGSLVITTG